jgi:FixJ family two-component response regulator
MRPRYRLRERPHDVFKTTAGGRMSKRSLVSVVEDDRFFRESMRRLMRSLGYQVDAFASAAEFLASPGLGNTACLIADVNMPVMTGVELYRHLIDSGYAIPTILVTAYADDDVRSRALKDGVVCYLRKPVDEKHLERCLLAALRRRD